MARGRSLGILGALLLLTSGAAWLATQFDRGPKAFQDSWQPLLAAAALALLLQFSFIALHIALARRKTDAARSLIHIQSIATAVVALIATGAVLGGFQAILVSLGLIGFGLTLALQRPILALAGWAALVFGGSVRVGDRIKVDNLSGDVLDITLFATKLWEVGDSSSSTPGRPTGRIVTVSNAVFLEKPVANATSDTPMVFDEFVVNVAFESDLGLARQLLEKVSKEVLSLADHAKLARTYRKLTKGLAMEADFPEHPIILAESKPSWMEFRLRYLVDARRAGRTQSKLTEAWTAACEPHGDALPQVYTRSQPQAVGPDGRARP